MARKISHTLILEGELVADTPLHIGGADTGHNIDMPLAVDGLGRYYLPGTSIAGAIRAWERVSEDDEIWGYAKKDQGNASFLIIDDAPAINAPLAELWHGVGIDRRFGSAAMGIKFDRQVLPQGTKFAFRLSREVSDENALEKARIFMGRLMIALESGYISFGGCTTRGFGRMSLQAPVGQEINWGSKQGVLSWLTESKPVAETACYWRKTAEQETLLSDQIEIVIHWQPKGPLMSKAARDGIAADALPFTSRNRDGKEALTLPGSSIKGALRQQAERIVRTVLDMDVDAKARHLDQVDVPLVRELFGAARPADKKGEKGQAARGLLAVDTCYAKLSLKTEEWDALDADAAAWRTTNQPLYKADHVSIDRWTGAAADGALFNTVEPDKSVTWEPIRLRLDCRPGQALPAFALLWLTLRDFAAGRIPLGFGVNRGYGDLTVLDIQFIGLATLKQEDAKLDVTEGVIADHPIVKQLKTAWNDWLKAKQTQEAA